MRVPMIALSTLLLVGIAAADDESGRAKLMGKWQQSDGEEAAKSTWALEEVTADSIRVTNSSGGQTVTVFECNTLGKECTVKDAGRKSKVSMWFNGPKLVELETKGAQVVKRRFSITGDGDAMELETMPIAPAGKVEASHFKRVPGVVAKQ